MFDFFMPDGRVYDCRPGWMHQLMTDTTIANFHEDSGFRRSVYCRKRQKQDQTLKIPFSKPRATAAARSEACSFSLMLLMWARAVRSEMPSKRPIS